MENTLENKSKFFAQYYGQNILMDISHGFKSDNEPNNWHQNFDNNYLELKPLSSTTDEDAYYVGASVNCWSWAERKQDWFKDSDDLKEIHVGYGKMFSSSIGQEYGPGLSHPFAHNSTDILHGFDYLRSKGYVIPFMGLGVEKLIEYGWIKLIL